MIYCNLKGGLGNMLFQIITCKSFAYDRSVESSFPNLYQLLDYLNKENVHNPSMQHSFEYLENLDIFKNLRISIPDQNIPIINFPFEYVELDLPKDNFMIDGFFQSEKFFAHNRKNILEWTKIPNKVQEIIDQKYNHILNKETTSIHIRRGDYLRFPSHHFVQPLEYYLNGVEILKNKTDLFVLFSDDIEWCKNNLQLPNCVYIENEKDYIELYLMSLCKNNITSNSSFSWWGSWINTNPNKTVIGPKNWFGPAITHRTDDIIPESWIKL